MRDTIIFGERVDDIGDELLGLEITDRSGGGVTVEVPFKQDGPLLRALFRAEAELLIADAEAMAAGSFRGRTPGQRQADALVLVAERLGEAVIATEAAQATRAAAAVPARVRSSRSRKRRGRSR